MRVFRFFFIFIMMTVLFATCFACNKADDNTDIDNRTEAEKEIAASAEQSTELEFIYVSDTHYMREEEVGDYTYNSFSDRDRSSQKINYLSEALFQQFCDDVIASGVKILLIGGDLNETGSYYGHVEVVEQLDRVRAAGVAVYVAPGNHDIYEHKSLYTDSGTAGEEGYGNYCRHTTTAEFASLYANYGFTSTNRINVGESADDFSYCGSLSYTVDLNSKYTLIAVDNATSTKGYFDSFDEETEEYDKDWEDDRYLSSAVQQWIITQVENTVAAGKTPLLMMHKPLTEIFVGLDNLASIKVCGTFINEDKNDIDKFGKKLYKAGLDYCFVGHMHSNDIMCTDFSKEDEDFGIVQFMNCTMTGYNCNYFDIKFKAGYVESQTRHISVPKESYLPSYLSASDKNAILTNWKKYAYDYTKKGFAVEVLDMKWDIKTYLAEYVCGIPYEEMSLEQASLVSTFVDSLFTYLETPIYTSDKAEGETSLEELLKKYGYTGTLPSSEYESVIDIVAAIILDCFTTGEKNTAVDGTEWILAKYGIYGLLAMLVESDLYGLMESFSIEIENVDSTPMITKLLSTGILDLETYSTIDNLLKLPVLANIDNDIVEGLLASAEIEGVWKIMGGALSIVELLLGEGVNIRSYFVTIKSQENNGKSTLTGEIYLDKLLDELVFTYIGKGIFYDEYSATQDVVINRTTGKAYDK